MKLMSVRLIKKPNFYVRYYLICPKCSISCGICLSSDVQGFPGIFQKLLHKSAVAHGQNIQWNIPLNAAVCYVFVPFLMQYFKNILQV